MILHSKGVVLNDTEIENNDYIFVTHCIFFLTVKPKNVFKQDSNPLFTCQGVTPHYLDAYQSVFK